MNTKFSRPVLEIKSLADDGTIAGYASVFGNKDSYGDIVMKGAFVKSLALHKEYGTRPKMFWQHDMAEPIGSWINAQEDQYGLFVEGKINMNVRRGQEAHALLKNQDIDGLSIGYRIGDSEYDKKQDALLLKEVDLLEVSIVSIGANNLALVNRVKSCDDLRAAFAAGRTPSLKTIEEYLREAGFPNALATSFVSLGKAAFRQSDSGENQPDSKAFLQALLGT